MSACCVTKAAKIGEFTLAHILKLEIARLNEGTNHGKIARFLTRPLDAILRNSKTFWYLALGFDCSSVHAALHG